MGGPTESCRPSAGQPVRAPGRAPQTALDGWSHQRLQGLLHELMTQQGKAERIKNFPFPRQYATLNHFFALPQMGTIHY